MPAFLYRKRALIAVVGLVATVVFLFYLSQRQCGPVEAQPETEAVEKLDTSLEDSQPKTGTVKTPHTSLKDSQCHSEVVEVTQSTPCPVCETINSEIPTTTSASISAGTVDVRDYCYDPEYPCFSTDNSLVSGQLISGQPCVVKVSEKGILKPKEEEKVTEDISDSVEQEIASTGHLFSGKRVRAFPKENLKFVYYRPRDASPRVATPSCKRWAVMTTIFDPSEALDRLLRLEDWCVVIVGDGKTPGHKYTCSSIPGMCNRVSVYLSPDDQKVMSNAFVDALPWNNFGRKNVGFLYATMHGATVIWDFDDDNLLKFWIPGAAPPNAPDIESAVYGENIESVEVLEPLNHTFPTYNPYPYLGAPTNRSWPRGFPLSHIKIPQTYKTLPKPTQVPRESIAVLQSLADHEPDVDAIYRITMPIPFSFKRTTETKPLMVPTGVLTPYNAQATLHFEAGFWGLLLPTTVHGRVSDIWRSYFAQRLFWDVGLRLGFIARPLVVQDRNEHSYLADLDAETDLHQKSEHLVEFLGRWKGKGATLVERVEKLWVTMYEHAYIELHDVELIQLWLQALIDCGYKFPELITDKELVLQCPSVPSENIAKSESEEDVCDKRSLTFWTSDLHDGSRMDMPSTLSSLGHKVIVAGSKPYPSVHYTKGISGYKQLSSTIQKYSGHSTVQLTENMVRSNFDYYKNDPKIASTDAFMCQFPASMCEMWMPFNKTIVFLSDHQYSLGRCTIEEWRRLNEHLSSLATMDDPRHIISATSVYDKEYIRHYLGIDALPLYSYAGFYTANHPYKPTRDEILEFGLAYDSGFNKITNFKIVKVQRLYPRYELSDLVNHRAAIYLPDSMMSHTLMEVYSLSIPLFMPSMKYLQTVGGNITGPRCRNPSMVEEMRSHPSSIHPYGPDRQHDAEAEFYWLQLADLFQSPHIIYFDSMRDLEHKLSTTDFEHVHKLMVKENERKKEALLNTWCEATKRIQTGRKVPTSYDTALKELYGVSQLQAV